MNRCTVLVPAIAALCDAASADSARALVDEFYLTTEKISRVEVDLYEIAYSDELVVTSNCWTYAYNDAAVVTSRSLIFIDQDEVCTIVGRKPKPTA